MLPKKVQIRSTGRYLPPRLVTNQDLEALMDTTDEWIRKRSGIESRYFADEGVETSDLALEASRKALTAGGLVAKDLDMIITATLSPDHHFPGIGVKLQHKLGLSSIPAMDIRNQCSGFLFALNTACLYVASGQYRRILVVGAEIHSKLINLTTAGRDIAVLFGDGSGALIVEPAEDTRSAFKTFRLHSDGEHATKLWLDRPGTGGRRFMEHEDIEQGRHFPYMEGKTVFKHATHRLTETLTDILEEQGLTPNDVDHYLFHQANIRINEAVAQKLHIPSEKVHNNIQRYGNCSAASLPILLDECLEHGTIKRGETLCMAAFGAGFTWASCLLTY